MFAKATAGSLPFISTVCRQRTPARAGMGCQVEPRRSARLAYAEATVPRVDQRRTAGALARPGRGRTRRPVADCRVR